MRLRTWLALVFLALIIAGLLAAVALGVRNDSGDITDAISLLTLFGFAAVGALIVLRRPANLIGWIFCLDALVNTFLGVANQALLYTMVTQPGALPGAVWLAWVLNSIGDVGWALLFTFTFLLFPTGSLPSPRWRPFAILIVALIAFHTLVAMFRPGPYGDWPTLSNPLGLPVPNALLDFDKFLGVIVLFIVVGSVGSLVLRFRAARGVTRQQIKWIAYVAAVMLALLSLSSLIDAINLTSSLGAAVNLLATVVFALFPIVVGLSILRNRLLDIDFLIQRTLVYAALTGVLALLYAVSTIVFQQLLGRWVGSSQVVIVLSTLVIAAVFTPLRRRLQVGIDRRFYRRKVDAAQTLAAFSLVTRDEVDLDRLTQALLESVAASVQPAHLTLWLPEPQP